MNAIMPRPLVPNGFQRTCLGCGTQWIAKGNRAKYCSTACASWVHKGNALKDRHGFCKTCGCVTATRKFKYCSTKCRPVRRPDGRADTTPVTLRTRKINCAFCDKSFVTTKTLQRYCSKWCSDTGSALPGTYALRLGRKCGYCGVAIAVTARLGKRFCSPVCQNINTQQARRARRRGLTSEPINRWAIFERDEWICHPCGTSIDAQLKNRHPLSASIDHIIPLADPYSPGHVASNVAAAHLRCNISKGAGALVGR